MRGFYEVRVESHVGLVRGHNEDALRVEPGVLVLADGMGGHEAGEVASARAVEIVASHAVDLREATADKAMLRALFESVFQEASTTIEQHSGGNGMGTTLVCAVLAPDGVTVFVAHVGDSRAYVVHDGELRRITSDHNIRNVLLARGRTPEEVEAHPAADSLTQAVGLGIVQPDIAEIQLHPGDTLLLCTDGLTDVVDDAAIASHLELELEDAALALVDAAYAAGAPDNVSLMTARTSDDASGLWVRDAHAHLRRLVLFQDLSAAQLAAVAPFLNTRTYERGTCIAHEGEDAEECLILTRGVADVMRGDARVNRVTAGSSVGELALVGPWRRNASIHAAETVKAWIFTRSAFEELCRTRPRIGAAISIALARVAAERLTEVTTRLDLVFRAAMGQLESWQGVALVRGVCRSGSCLAAAPRCA